MWKLLGPGGQGVESLGWGKGGLQPQCPGPWTQLQIPWWRSGEALQWPMAGTQRNQSAAWLCSWKGLGCARGSLLCSGGSKPRGAPGVSIGHEIRCKTPWNVGPNHGPLVVGILAEVSRTVAKMLSVVQPWALKTPTFKMCSEDVI